MKNKLIYMSVVFLLAYTFSFTSHAAEITRAPKDEDGKKVLGILIEGKIVKGDYEKLYKLLKKEGPSWSTIYIASPGGDVAEAIKIGVLVRKLLLQVRTPSSAWSFSPVIDKKNAHCSSACFLIYSAGILRAGNKIGIHRPSLTTEQLKEVSLSEASVENSKIRAVVNAYLTKMGVPQKYTDRMFSIAHDDVEFLSYTDIRDDFSDFDASVNEWLEARCEKLSTLEADMRMTLITKEEEKTAAEQQYLDQLNEKWITHIKCKKKNAILASQEAWVNEFVDGSKEAYEKAARLFHFGNGVIKDASKAIEYYKKAASKGSGFAMFWLGNAHRETVAEHQVDFGVSRSNETAIKWYKKGIKVNSPSSYVALGEMYANGEGVDKNLPKAISYYQRGIEIERNRDCVKKSMGEEGFCWSIYPIWEKELEKLRQK